MSKVNEQIEQQEQEQQQEVEKKETQTQQQEQPEQEEKKETKPTKRKPATKKSVSEDVIKEKDEQIETLQQENESLQAKITQHEQTIQSLELKIQELQQQLNSQSVLAKLAQNGLTEFSDFFANVSADKVDEHISKFKEKLQQQTIANGYVPSSHTTDSKYEQAKKSGNLMDMIKLKMFSGN